MAGINIAGYGMVASLGYDAASCCAAARAGLTRPRVLENYKIRSAVDGEPEPIIGHPAHLLTHGFAGDARLIRLAQGALRDLSIQSGGLSAKNGPSRFYLSIPNPNRTAAAGVEKKPQPDPALLARMSRILTKALALSDGVADFSIGHISASGHPGGLAAILAAATDLAAGKIAHAIVLGVDSLLDEDTLVWLNQHGRLKSDGAPAGLQPGEAGVALLLSRNDIPSPVPAAGVIRNLAVNLNGDSLLLEEAATGVGLAEAITQVGKASPNAPVWIISDHNGEIHRATDWGYAITRLRGMDAAYAAPSIWHPAAYFGDTGAASGLLAVCVACRAFNRKYAAADEAIVVSAADGKERGALRLGRIYN